MIDTCGRIAARRMQPAKTTRYRVKHSRCNCRGVCGGPELRCDTGERRPYSKPPGKTAQG